MIARLLILLTVILYTSGWLARRKRMNQDWSASRFLGSQTGDGCCGEYYAEAVKLFENYRPVTRFGRCPCPAGPAGNCLRHYKNDEADQAIAAADRFYPLPARVIRL